MKKKDFVFTLGLTLFMGILWIVGELVMGLWIAVVPAVRMAWRIAIIVLTVGISVWHSLIEDKSEKKYHSQDKYERKTNNRSNKNNKKNSKKKR
ncbi:MAG: hypothetical protein LIO40_02385, partial [Ruminococcus sp.]|nr:hypothetical protein [Ruminococcus sp.]